MELGCVPIREMCPRFRGCYVQVSMELGPEDVSLLERCPHFRGCYASMDWGPEDVSVLEKYPYFSPSLNNIVYSRRLSSSLSARGLG